MWFTFGATFSNKNSTGLLSFESYPEHSVAQHVAEGLVHAVAVVLGEGLGGHEHVLPGDEAVAGQRLRDDLLGEGERHGAAELVVEEPQRLGGLDVGVEGGAVAAVDLVAGLALPEGQVLVAVERADRAQVVGVPFPRVHRVR